MRVRIPVLTGCLLTLPLPLLADSGSGTPDPRHLDAILHNWEQTTRSVIKLRGEFIVETLDTVFREKTQEQGRAWALKPHYGRLDLWGKQGTRRIFISTDKAIHQYEFKTKQELVHLLPEGMSGEKMLPGPLTFVFGMSADEAKTRFNIKLYQENKKHAWVEVSPKRRMDQQDFAKAKLVFNKTTHMPTQMLIIQPNGVQQRWIFTRLETNLDSPFDLQAKTLAPLPIPRHEGWTREVIPWSDEPNRRTARKQPQPGARPPTSLENR